MKRCQEGNKGSEGRPSRLSLFLGLGVLLPIFLLPLTFYVHLTAAPLPAASGELKTGPLAMESRTEEADRPHDSNSCPICLAAESFQNYGLSLSLLTPDTSFVRFVSSQSGFAALAEADFFTAETRAPPVMPLSQTSA